ncbi:hypothetical protein GC173_11775 [bacterium]|nr:hypothetical protein [bacterium]
MKIRITTLVAMGLMLAEAPALAQQSPTPTPTPDPCAIPCGIATPTPTVTPAPPPPPIPTPERVNSRGFLPLLLKSKWGRFQNLYARYFEANTGSVGDLTTGTTSAKFLETDQMQARYGGFGSRWYLSPLDETNPSPVTFAPPPGQASTGKNMTFFNSWSPLVSQAMYRGGMWTSDDMQNEEFAKKIIFMCGAVTNTISNLETGPGKTRPEVINPGDLFFKYTIGAWNQAQIMGGGTAADLYTACGSVSFGFTSFFNPNATEEGTGLKQMYATLITGAENGAIIGRRIGPDMGLPGAMGEVDGRQGNIKEDDWWDAVPANIGLMVGTTNSVFVDNKRLGECEPPGTVAGHVGTAVGTRSGIVGSVQGSWINVDEAIGTLSLFGIGAGLPSSPDYFCNGSERAGSRVGAWKAFEAAPPSWDPTEVTVGSSNAALFYSQDIPDAGGAPVMGTAQVQKMLGSNADQAASVEEFATLIARGDVVVGDGQAMGHSPYDTDVLHVKDVIHLQPRTEPPTFDENTAPSDRVGLLYFDVTRNALRVSLPVGSGGGQAGKSWKSSEVVWVDLATVAEKIDPQKDIVGGKKGEGLTKATAKEAAAQIENAAKEAADGASPYAVPKATVLIASEGLKDTSGAVTMNVMLSSYGKAKPRVFWKRLGRGHYLEGETDWQEIPSEKLAVPAGATASFGALTGRATLAAPGKMGSRGKSGDVIQFLFVHPETGQTTATSARL